MKLWGRLSKNKDMAEIVRAVCCSELNRASESSHKDKTLEFTFFFFFKKDCNEEYEKTSMI